MQACRRRLVSRPYERREEAAPLDLVACGIDAQLQCWAASSAKETRERQRRGPPRERVLVIEARDETWLDASFAAERGSLQQTRAHFQVAVDQRLDEVVRP